MRTTKTRTAVLDVFKSSHTPLDASTIFAILNKKGITIDLTTIYRSITAFLESGIVNAVDFADGVTRYELSSLPHHHHAICTDCGNVQDVQNCNSNSVQSDVEKKLKFKIKTHSMEFFGLCSNCK